MKKPPSSRAPRVAVSSDEIPERERRARAEASLETYVKLHDKMRADLAETQKKLSVAEKERDAAKMKTTRLERALRSLIDALAAMTETDRPFP